MSRKGKFVPLTEFVGYPEAEMAERSRTFYEEMRRRRTVRMFSDRPVPQEIIETCLLTASSAPNGANMQPWHFAVVSDPAVKARIRQAAEAEEREFYEERAPMEWLQALEPFDTDWEKPFLETAPYLIVIFAQSYSYDGAGRKTKHYYVTESVGIATGMLITAVHHAGLASLTHTPSPMKFLNEICGRPEYERPFLILVVGYPAEDAEVPAIRKKSLAEISTFFTSD
jgi:iodotyrosine deiodinase